MELLQGKGHPLSLYHLSTAIEMNNLFAHQLIVCLIAISDH